MVSLGGGTTAGSVQTGAPTPTPLTASPVTLPGAHAFTAGGADQSAGGGGNLTLAAGTYGALSTGNNATNNLTSGIYYFDSFTVGGGTRINLDLGFGDIILNIVGDLSTGSNVNFVLSNGGGPFDVLFEVHGDTDIGGGSTWVGTLFAPDSEIKFGNNVTISGAIYGDVVDIGGGSRLHHVPSNILFANNGNPNPAPVPEPGMLAIFGLSLLGLGLVRRRAFK